LIKVIWKSIVGSFTQLITKIKTINKRELIISFFTKLGAKTESKSLFWSIRFWVVLITPIVTSYYLAKQISEFEGLYYVGFTNINLENIKRAYDHFQIPLLLTSLVFPLVALITANHRSIQTAAQINLALMQHNLAAQNDHKSLFSDLLTQIEEENKVRFSNKKLLYMNFFPLNNHVQFKSVKVEEHPTSIIHSFKANVDQTFKYASEIQRAEHGSETWILKHYGHIDGVDSTESAVSHVTKELENLMQVILTSLNLFNASSISNMVSGTEKFDQYDLSRYFSTIIEIELKIGEFCYVQNMTKYMENSMFYIEFPFSAKRASEKRSLKQTYLNLAKRIYRGDI